MRAADQRVLRLAERQYSLITRAQATSYGLSEDEVDGRLARAEWIRLYRSVYKIAGSAPTHEGRVLPAVLAGGDGALASHMTAARLVQFEGIEDGGLHITVQRCRRVVIPGVTVHQSSVAWGAARMRKIPATSPVRTLIDIAGLVGPTVLEDALDDVWRRRMITIKGCLDALDRLGPRGPRGAKTLRKLLVERVGQRPSGSGRENATRRLLEAAGLPTPERQLVIRDDRGVELARPDLAYPEVKIAIEFDSTTWHASKESLARDHARFNRLSAEGWLVFLADDDQLTHPERFGDNVRRAFTARRTENARVTKKRPVG